MVHVKARQHTSRKASDPYFNQRINSSGPNQTMQNYSHLSEQYKNTIYNEINSLLKNLYKQAEIILSNNFTLLEKIANKLLEQEEIIKEEIEEIVGNKINSEKVSS